MSRTKVDVLIMVHHPQRELDIAALLKTLIERDHGLSVAIESYRYNDYRTLARWNPKLVVLPWFYLEEKGFNRYREYWPDALFVDMAYEQIYQKINEGLKVIEGEYARTKMRFSAWGEFYREFLAASGIPRDRVDICGNPSYGLYLKPYSQYFVSRETLAKKHGIDPGKRWVFFPENYRAAFMSREQLDRFEKTMNVPGISNDFRDFAEESLRTVCRWMEEIPEGTHVILRPRPAVGMDPFLEKVGPWIEKSKSRILVTTDASVREWILESDFVVSSYSTSLIESSVAEKPIAILEPVPFPDFVMNDWYTHVDRVKTCEEFQAVLSGATGLGQHQSLKKWAEEVVMPNGDPLKNTAAWIADIAKQHASGLVEAPGEGSRAAKAKMKFLGDELKWKLRGKRENIPMKDWFDEADARQRTEKWRQLLEGVAP